MILVNPLKASQKESVTEYQKKRLLQNAIDSENACSAIGECQTSKTKKRKEQNASYMRQ